MPGRLVMDQEGTTGLPELKKDRSHVQVAKLHSQPLAVQDAVNGQLNGLGPHGSNGNLANGVPASSEAQHTGMNGESSHNMVTEASDSREPPPLDQSWRQQEQYKPLSLLMERVAQQCYHDLNKTLDEMASVPVEPQQPHPNGVLPQVGPDASEASLSKKRILMNFATDQRDRFTKTLVLSDWCRNADEKARLIDIKVWQDQQRAAYETAERAIADAKAAMRIGAKMPNPNIDSAMEVLATGKASWVPDFGYIPPKRLSAKQLLKTIRDMNVALATRLSIHEELPIHFNDYTIADGRATFSVQDEFEVDLSVADEDPSTPFYFIDIRLSFQPASAVLNDRIRSFLETKVNQQLAVHGLRGCHDFLHNFVLTHKLNVLRSQATDLLKGKWFDCIRVENLRRSLVVQYWVGMSGQKSWIEIGISSGKQKDTRSTRPANSHIAVRWFRNGGECKDDVLHLDCRTLDIEKCLSKAIDRHTARFLSDLSERVKPLAPAEAPVEAAVQGDEDTKDGKILSITVPSLPQPIVIRIDPVTGQLSITPPSAQALNTERRLNNDLSSNAARRIAGLLCVSIQERTRREAELLGWSIPTNLARQDNLNALFDGEAQHFSIFTPSHAWGERWALAVTFSLGGEKWWILELKEKHSEHIDGMGKIIASTRPLTIPHVAGDERLAISRTTLLRVRKWAVADVDFSTLSNELHAENIPFTVEKLVAAGEGTERQSPVHSTALFIRSSKLMSGSQGKQWQPWANELARLTHYGFVSSRRKVEGNGDGLRHDLRLCLEEDRMKEVRKHIGGSSMYDLALTSSGGMSLRFVTPFGQPFVRQMQDRLHSVELLDRYATILKQHRLPCTNLDLSRLTFLYSKTPELSAELVFPNNGEVFTQLKLHPLTTNPHQRTRLILESGLNHTTDRGFEALVSILLLTRPVLQAFDRLEAKDATKRVMSVHVVTSTSFIIGYHAPLPECSFRLRSLVRREGGARKVRWLLDNVRASAPNQSLPDELGKTLKDLFQQSDEHWDGVGSGIVADERGGATIVEKVDEIIRRSSPSKDPSQSAESTQQKQVSAPPTTTTATTSQAKPSSQPAKPASAAPAKPIKQEHEVITLD